MVRINPALAFAVLLGISGSGCQALSGRPSERFDNLRETVDLGNWKYDLRVENQSRKSGTAGMDSDQYLKATLSVGNSKTNKSLLYSASKDSKDYEAKYKYLSFAGGEDLCLKYDGKTVHPIGYLFEPSNGLVPTERLIYKFLLQPAEYEALQRSNHVEYWYTDHLVGLGKICFNTNN